MERKLISLCVPVLNEAENIQPFYDRVSAVIGGLSDHYDFEFLFTDNHSSDRTFEILIELAQHDRRVRAIRFSRNFGFQRSILTNYRHARGLAAIQLDCDLQDPPEMIVEFLRHWEQGYQVVYGVRRRRPNEAMWLQLSRRAFYRLIDFLSEERLPHDAGDFRLIGDRILEYLRRYNDPQPYLRGTISTLGFRQIGVPYDRSPRTQGKSKFNLFSLIALAVDGLCNHSTVPLRFASLLGVGFFLLAVLGTVYYAIGRFSFAANWPVGLASSSILMLFSIGMNALFLGIIGEYVGRIFKAVKMAPVTVIENVVDADLAANSPKPEGNHS
jgi:glycosyltransferase involved in cell wall biosynthesis